MKLIVSIALLALVSCSSSDKEKEPETDITVASAFVKAIMKNDFDKADKYMLHDADNISWLNRFKQSTSTLSKEELEKRRNGEIIVNETSYVSDSIFIFNYTPSFKPTEKTKIKVVRYNNKWQVDLKYTFSGNL